MNCTKGEEMPANRATKKEWRMKTCAGEEVLTIIAGMEQGGWTIFTVTGNGVMEQKPNIRDVISNSHQQKQMVGLYTVIAWKEKRG